MAASNATLVGTGNGDPSDDFDATRATRRAWPRLRACDSPSGHDTRCTSTAADHTGNAGASAITPNASAGSECVLCGLLHSLFFFSANKPSPRSTAIRDSHPPTAVRLCSSCYMASSLVHCQTHMIQVHASIRPPCHSCTPGAEAYSRTTKLEESRGWAGHSNGPSGSVQENSDSTRAKGSALNLPGLGSRRARSGGGGRARAGRSARPRARPVSSRVDRHVAIGTATEAV